MARWVLLWLALFGVYAATLGIDAIERSDYSAEEAHYLLATRSIVKDHNSDVADEYAAREYREFFPGRLTPDGQRTDGRLNEPRGLGLPLLLAPAYALAGPTGVELFLAAIAALAFVLAAALARRLVPEPWATAAPVVCALSPPVLAYATAVSPELPAGALLAGACLLALKLRDRPRRRTALGCGALLAPLPWLGLKFVAPGAVVALVLVRWLLRRERQLAALLGIEVVLASAVTYVTVSDRLFDGFTPYAALPAGVSPTGASSLGDYLARGDRLVSVWLDRDVGLLRWAPFFALAFLAVWLLWRSRRERLARALPDVVDLQVAGGLLVAVAGAQVLVAAFLAPTLFPAAPPGRELVAALPIAAALTAWGLRHAPRVGAVLAGITLAGSVWLYLWLRLEGGHWVGPTTPAPWGPLERVFPPYADGATWADVVTGLAAGALAVLVAHEWREARRAPSLV
jgi:hypothetical protein